LRLSGRRDVHLVKIHALRVARPELFPFLRYQPNTMRGTLSNGCSFVFWWEGNPAWSSEGEIRIAPPDAPLGAGNPHLSSMAGPAPAWIPNFVGYRYIVSGTVSSGRSYIGLWNRTDGRPGSLVAAYGAQGEPVIRLGTADWTYEAVYVAPDFHMLVFTLVNAPQGSEPLYISTFTWSPPRACCIEPQRRHRR
jgi:hypothetical protein